MAVPVYDRALVADLVEDDLANAAARVLRVAELAIAEGERAAPFGVDDGGPHVIRIWPAVRVGERIHRLADRDVERLLDTFVALFPWRTVNRAVVGGVSVIDLSTIDRRAAPDNEANLVQLAVGALAAAAVDQGPHIRLGDNHPPAQ